MDKSQLRDVLKLLAIFKQKGLLPIPLCAVLKDAVLATTGPGVDIRGLCSRYNLDTLSHSHNLDTLLALHEELETLARLRLNFLIKPLFDEHSLARAHQGASIGSTELCGFLPACKEYDSQCFVYGEIEFDSFTQILNISLNGVQRKLAKFVDLGSGIAKAVIWASLVTNFKHLVGIEINPQLHSSSLSVLKTFQEIVLSNLYLSALAQTNRPKIELVLSSFLNLDIHDWTDADVVFANSALFTEELMECLCVFSIKMKPGSRFITLTYRLSDSVRWKIIYKDNRVDFSWGTATVWIHERVQT